MSQEQPQLDVYIFTLIFSHSFLKFNTKGTWYFISGRENVTNTKRIPFPQGGTENLGTICDLFFVL